MASYCCRRSIVVGDFEHHSAIGTVDGVAAAGDKLRRRHWPLHRGAVVVGTIEINLNFKLKIYQFYTIEINNTKSKK